jgi:hypothetical protein
VPKAGTDLVPGALALNLGNSLPGDTTNATDALTAAGFNAMANAVDTTTPLCGNAIQQAVTVAVGQSIACDAAAQEAIACAIASNPDAIACLQAVLCGSTTSGKYYVATSLVDPQQAKCYKVDNGVVTDLTPGGVPGFGTTIVRLLDVNKDNPVAYYWDEVSAGTTHLRQVTMSDTGVTVTNFNMTTTLNPPDGFSESNRWVFDYATYDPLTKALYVKVQANGRNPDTGATSFRLALVKVNLNAQGLATSASIAVMLFNPDEPAVVSRGYEGGQASDGKIPLTTGIYNAVTNTVIPSTTTPNSLDCNMSPDGTKYVGRNGSGSQTVRVFNTAANTLVCTINPPADMPANSAADFPFFSEDGTTVFVGWHTSSGTQSLKQWCGPRAYDATTGAEKNGSVFAWPVVTRPLVTVSIRQPNAVNNAVLLATGDFKQGIFEYKNDAWYQVADIPYGGQYAGFYLVSA